MSHPFHLSPHVVSGFRFYLWFNGNPSTFEGFVLDQMVTDFFGPIFMLPKVRVEPTPGPPTGCLSLVRAILVSRLIVLTNV
jgi:hypothetical protein